MDARESRSDETWLSPSARLLAMRRVEILVASVVVALGVLAPVLSAGGAVPVLVYAAIVVLCVGGEVVAGRRYRSWGYCERSRDLLVRRGVLMKRLTVVPYGRMQLVDVTAGAAERLFGLSTIKLHTAASTTDARIPGLRPDEATRLRDQLAALGEAQAAGV
ncbi:MAG: PH domain-containing protein [Acidimicrobiales bacterium]